MKEFLKKDFMAAKAMAICMLLSAAIIMGIGKTAMAAEIVSEVSGDIAVQEKTLETSGMGTVRGNNVLNLNTPSLKGGCVQDGMSLLPDENSLKSATYGADGVNLQMDISKSPIKTNSLTGVESAYDIVLSGYPVVYSGKTIYFNAASPTSDSIKVIAALVTITNPSGAVVYNRYDNLTEEEDWNYDNWYINWHSSVEVEMDSNDEGMWTYEASILCMDGTIYADSIILAVLNDREDQYIYADSTYTKTYGTGGFSLNAKTNGGGQLSYKSSNNNIVEVSSSGWVNIKGYGTAKITINAAQTNTHYEASKTVTVKIIPNTVKITKLTSPSKGKISCTWAKISSVTGYEMRLSGAGKSFVVTTKKNSAKGSGKSKKKYSVKVRAYKTVGGKKYYGGWSSVKSVKVK